MKVGYNHIKIITIFMIRIFYQMNKKFRAKTIEK